MPLTECEKCVFMMTHDNDDVPYTEPACARRARLVALEPSQYRVGCGDGEPKDAPLPTTFPLDAEGTRYAVILPESPAKVAQRQAYERLGRACAEKHELAISPYPPTVYASTDPKGHAKT